jgi:hypothetical protein
MNGTGGVGNNGSGGAVMGYGGQFVAFGSSATDLVSGDTNGKADVFVRDLVNNTTVRANVTASGTQADSHSSLQDISADGRFVVFSTSATNLVSGLSSPYYTQIYVKDLVSGSLRLVSSSSSGTIGNGSSSSAHISCDGGVLVFASAASNITSSDANAKTDVFIRLLSTDTDNVTNVTSLGNEYSNNPNISCNGNYVAFPSNATNLVSGDTTGTTDMVIYSRITKSMEIASVYTSGTQGSGSYSEAPQLSDDGRYVAFATDGELASNDTLGHSDVYIRDRKANTTQLLSIYANGNPTNGESTSPALSDDGKLAAYTGTSPYIVTGDTNGAQDVFMVETGF